MVILVILLIVTNLATGGLFAYFVFRPAPQARPDARLAQALDGALPRTATATGTRRVISVEVLNIIELAGTRGRLAGLAGSLMPGLTARIVYDQTIKILRKQLLDEQVKADVRMHTLRPIPPNRSAGPARGAAVEATSMDGLATLDEPGTGPGTEEAVPTSPDERSKRNQA